MWVLAMTIVILLFILLLRTCSVDIFHACLEKNTLAACKEALP